MGNEMTRLSASVPASSSTEGIEVPVSYIPSGEGTLPASSEAASSSSAPMEGNASNSEAGQETPASSQAEDSRSSAPASESEEVVASSLVSDSHNEPPPDLTSSAWSAASFFLGVLCAALALWLWKKGRGKKAKPVSVTEETTTGKSAALLTLEVGKLHEQGARADQQDCFSISDSQGMDTHGVLAVVADGMGGLTNGGRVSQCAVSAMMEGFYRLSGDPQGLLFALVERAVAAVNAELGPDGLNQSGSTLVAGLVKEGKFYYISVGDSRICLYRNGILSQLNRDHIFRRELEIQAINREIRWDEVAAHPKSQGLTSFLGMGALKYVDIPSQPLTLRHGDRLILMSDGVYNALTEAELSAELDKPAQDAATAIGAKIAAKNYEHQDNYTAILLAF